MSITKLCDYCGKPAIYTDSSLVYGKSYGMIYYCPDCHAWVGVHRGTDKPLGRLADAELRDWKKKAHDAFDPIWRTGRMKRNAAYAWLAQKLGIDAKEAHIGMFDSAQCIQVIQICYQERSDDLSTKSLSSAT